MPRQKKISKKSIRKIKAAKPEKEELLLQSPRGMRDILPADQIYWQQVRRVSEKAAADFGYRRIDVPLVEFTNIFSRSIGEGTDIIDKEMYSFSTKGGEKVSLRPEFTAGIARAYIQHGMHVSPKPVKLYYTGPCYRYDRPQEGRFREFFQFGCEALGEQDPVIDAQMIQMGWRVIYQLGIKNVRVNVNSIGCPSCRKSYRNLLIHYFESKKQKLCIDCKRRLETNPLRILDCKEDKCVQVRASAPQSIDHLCEECRTHFKELLEYLEELEIPFELDSNLVRGLDYYTKTVFEFMSVSESGEEKRKNALGGGGRYDGLVKMLGGENTPAVGFSLGLDRLAAEMKKLGARIYKEPKPRVFLAQLGVFAKKKSLKMFEGLERSGIRVAESFGRGSLKSQLKVADRLGVEITLILGQKEAIDQTVIVKDMASGNQEIIDAGKVIDEIKRRLKK
ncbi:MAG: histidyl-tRNA synthetase, histidyl-tRNA synthetase [Candidatus Moranbacteria bacterium GW2011_GWC1_45_18]|nr:MAG: Histidine-tRNA ligase [Candidatus Moranbacteria bacterium GW2011_GWC2_40_12]KKT32526.1 MAG: Histidine-tRNA ligase [Candidatus Moranbacteria bacterium GW2011_GWF2_44_10]KKT99709.1 MAG: histidyl-tRNA synthetase, histidyl-tRNA synthetase [Candidatus Moranbacteria bacterium GW2011_GWC1_45_18]HBB36531.1 histidine--tRNA ligase [Candidatus Moranbacteria bacterium]HBU25298.1 histidine--tRNA ligase [Candidatus Moranbacteria bacterium]